MDNAWGILRCIIDICMKQKEGKFLIMKDPNKPMIRLYDIPDNTFDSEGDDDEDDDSSMLARSLKLVVRYFLNKIRNTNT